jgi:hypothetical protein
MTMHASLVSANRVKVNVVTNVLAADDAVTLATELANTTADTGPVKVKVATYKLADNDPVHQTGTLKKAQFDEMNGKVIFQIPWSTHGEPLATAVTNIAVNSVSLQRILVSPLTVNLTDNDPNAFNVGNSNKGTTRNVCFQERGVVHLVPPDYNNNDRMSLTMALIDTLSNNEPYNNSRIVTPSK